MGVEGVAWSVSKGLDAVVGAEEGEGRGEEEEEGMVLEGDVADWQGGLKMR